MKQLLTATLMLCILLCTVSCSKESISIGEDIPFTFTTGNGEIIGFSRATIFTDTAGDFSQIYAHTDGSSAEGLFTLSIQTENCTGKEEGENIKIKEFSFCKPLSSNSKDYTTEYSGKIHFIQLQGSSVPGMKTILRFSEIKCTLNGETYSMNGDLHLEVIDRMTN